MSNLPKDANGNIIGGPGRPKGQANTPKQWLEQVKAWGLDPMKLATEMALDKTLKIQERQNALLMVMKRTVPEIRATEHSFQDTEIGKALGIVFGGKPEPEVETKE